MLITSSQRRKLFCLGGIVLMVALVVPLQHEISARQQTYGLDEATLGDVDPSSAAMNLVLVGLRGVAANLLWSEALDLQKNHDWPHLKTVVDSIVLLQPHFLEVWRFQGWNMAFNVVAEYDEARDKYDWIKAGANFLKEGVRRNQQSVDLMWSTAWIYHQKLGRSDEAPVMRLLFNEDEDRDFNSRGSDRWDNYLEAYGWFRRGSDTSTQLGREPRSMAAAIFHTYPAHAKTQHAVALEKDGTFGEVAREAWTDCLDEWTKLGLQKEHKVRDGLAIRLLYAPEDLQALNDEQRFWYDRYRWMTNYPYWLERAQVERLPGTLESRQIFWEGDRAFAQADLPKAREMYEKALALWQKVLDIRQDPPHQDLLRYREFVVDANTRDDTFEIVKRYINILAQLGEPKPDKIPFEAELLELTEMRERARQAAAAAKKAKPADEDSDHEHPPGSTTPPPGQAPPPKPESQAAPNRSPPVKPDAQPK